MALLPTQQQRMTKDNKKKLQNKTEIMTMALHLMVYGFFV